MIAFVSQCVCGRLVDRRDGRPAGYGARRMGPRSSALDYQRLAALNTSPGFLAKSLDDQVSEALSVAIDRSAPLAQWQRWVEYPSEAECEAGRRNSEANARRGLTELARHPTGGPEVERAKRSVRFEGEVDGLRFREARCVPAVQAPR